MPSYTLVHLGLTGEQGRDRFFTPPLHPIPARYGPLWPEGVVTLQGHPRPPFGRFPPKPGWSSMKLMLLKPCVEGFEVRDETPVANSSADGGGSPWYIGRLYRFLTLYFRGWRDA